MQDRQILVVALFDGLIVGHEVFHEDDARHFLQRGHGHHILVGLQRDPDVAFHGVAHHIAQKVANVAAIYLSVKAILAREDLQVEFFD